MSRLPRAAVLGMALAAAGCDAVRDAEGPPEPPDPLAAAFRELEPGELQDEVLQALGAPDDSREWAVAVPWWGPGENLASELPLGNPVITWSYRVGGQVYYVHFDAAKAGKPLLGVEAYPEGAIF